MQVDLHNGSKKALVVVYTETGPPENLWRLQVTAGETA